MGIYNRNYLICDYTYKEICLKIGVFYIEYVMESQILEARTYYM
jgi:hypothetical protein